MTTIADLQTKIVNRMEDKFKGGASKQRLTRILQDRDGNNDGFISLKEFNDAFDVAGLSLRPDEMSFLFQFWDTMAGQQEPQGVVEIALAVSDLMSSKPTYGGVFNSGPEAFKVKGDGKNNKPSQAGGIFGGGAFAADAVGEINSYRGQNGPSMAMPSQPDAAPRPRGNQSSIEGGIFGGEMQENAAPASNRGGGTNRNQSSIQGGIFGDAMCAPAPTKGNRSNQSSIPGGIFG